MDIDWEAVLVCPRCRGDVAWGADRAALRCERCAVDYPVVDGVPWMLPERAKRAKRAVTRSVASAPRGPDVARGGRTG